MSMSTPAEMSALLRCDAAIGRRDAVLDQFGALHRKSLTTKPPKFHSSPQEFW